LKIRRIIRTKVEKYIEMKEREEKERKKKEREVEKHIMLKDY